MRLILAFLLLGVCHGAKLYFRPQPQNDEEQSVKVEVKKGITISEPEYVHKHRTGDIALPVDVEEVICPGNKSACPNRNTCCVLPTKQFACCPFPNAVCCPDHKHCCPFSTRCDVTKGQCVKGQFAISWTSNMKSESKVDTSNKEKDVTTSLVSVGDVTKTTSVRCDETHFCPDGNTCCKTSSGVWGCCPLLQAVCCPDGEHCCPSGTTCDVASGKCNKGDVQKEWFSKTPALVNLRNVPCPDGHSCADGQTCCKLVDGKYGCCPLPNAVCCSDGQHCCPSGTTCDVSSGKCKRGDFQIDWFSKTPALVNLRNVPCPDGHSCADGQTCCKLVDGNYGCCPIPNAVCCSDGEHCCPSGTTCDVSSGKCNRGDFQIDWFSKTPALVNLRNVPCPDGHSCADGQTCCKLVDGKYGCCPIPNAVCCSDGEHCCPSGTTCDVSSGKCKRGDFQIDWFSKTPALVNLRDVQCPDGQSSCADGQTCCKLVDGNYGCCPIPNAVCCSDGQHCCPSGTTCDVSSGKCNRGDFQIDWFSKTPALVNLRNVPCPDGHSCADGQTCCKLVDGKYGCCPIPNAVCCSDGEHCCPSGTTCDVSSGKCKRGDFQIDWFSKTPALVNLRDVQCPDGQSSCADGQTCCKLVDGNYGCCPIPNAVCCSDGQHCCPSGTTCAVSSGKCKRGDFQIDWFSKTPALVNLRNVPCPDGHSCADGQTCCKLVDGNYGCCPIPNAVCCSDGEHCCPSGTTCAVSSGKCNRGDFQIDWFSKTPALVNLRNVPCPDGHSCADGQTCCKLVDGKYGCCPIPNAVCCSDGEHCCPSGTTCDVSSGKCKRGDFQIDWFSKTPALVNLRDVQCPDGQSSCADGQTCCKLVDGNYGCCPIPNAVCCSDGQHCCPSGTTCAVSSGKCKRGDFQIDWFSKTPALVNLRNVPCPDGHSCADGQTCCKLVDGNYGCCPIPNAVCCSDGEHCCPSGTTCAVSSGKCNRGDFQIDWFSKTPALVNLRNVPCPDGHSCADGQTCCKLVDGKYGCCPIPNAVCCSDGEHCCPSGTTCDVSSGKCKRGDFQIDWFSKTPALVNLRDVQCPDGQSSCADGQTCCKLVDGNYGCCPIPNAVCCSDGQHCCPSGTTCAVSSGKCKRGDFQIDWFSKTPALVNLRNVPCPDGHSCADGQTCCKLVDGNYGCCPIPNAVCCSDGEHCCPSGTTCAVSSGKCNRGDFQIDWFSKTPALVNLRNVPCPDGHSCADGQTCCKLVDGKYGCCPIPNAVCCSDGEHCCPSGTTCDVSSGKCNRGDFQIDWFSKTPALVNLRNVPCPDGHSCADGQTCCKLVDGNYGCCPIPNAVCCSDGEHCCPSGTTCAVSSGKCNRGDFQIDWFSKTPALVNLRNVPCPDGHSCADGQTCCKLVDGNYGCCPIPNAVCCSDGEHCCPSGTTCDVSSGKCNRGDFQIDWFSKTPALVNLRNVPCPDGHSCADGQTCCKLVDGKYGCCPIPNAVCCSDGEHCCPSGTTCDVSSGKCNRGDFQIEWFSKTPALVNLRDVQCPDGQSSCADGQTCCKLAGGEYGCCPIPNAVCCSDGEHCCPSGTTCAVSSGKCNRGDFQIDWFSKTPALVNLRNVPCPDGHSCADGQTCCKLVGGNYGCCPIPNAVCCSDGEHCCPSGTSCDVSSGKCNRGDFQIDWFSKTPALVNLRNVPCPDGHSCADGQTCCKLVDGKYGCCPIPNAVCCSDGQHCCPSGTTCDVSSGKCNRGDFQIEWFSKTPALVNLRNVPCPDGHSCADGQTCCKLVDGKYGCCPIPNAVCCSDGEHCCPSGTTCAVSSGKCNRGDFQIDWFSKTPALVNLRNVPCPDGHSCADGQTCCKLVDGKYGCCPIPNAVCCSDGEHCCPSGTTCDVSSGKCNRGDFQIEWFSKTPALVNLRDVQCPDGQSSCADGQTCCKLAGGEYGCCPIPNAVCCSDGKHCCPSGTTCDVSSGKCKRGDFQIDWFSKTPALPRDSKVWPLNKAATLTLDIVCPDGSECSSGSTCCPMEGTTASYGCCPTPNAVCCTDRKHCCPTGYSCNLSAGTCDHGNQQVPWIDTSIKKMPGTNEHNLVKLILQKTKDVVCPDKKSNCPSGNICCTDKSGGYNCCPYSDGVCCSTSKFCCPNKYICDEGPGICRIPEDSKAFHLSKLLAMIKPNSQP